MTELYSQTNKDKEEKSDTNKGIYSSNPKNIVPVFSPDNKRLKNTNENRAKKWIKQEKAIPVKLPNGKYAIQLKEKPVGNVRVPVLNPDGTPGMPTKIETKTKLKQGINFDIITRPKYSRRKLHNEKVNPQDKRLTEKGHRQRKRFGGTTTDWTDIRKGDYAEIKHRKKDELRKKGYIPMIYRGWVGGFENDKKLISLYNFDWEVIGQFDHGSVRLLNRNHGLMVKSIWMEEICHNLISGGMKQSTVDGTNIDLEKIKRNNDKVKERRKQCEFVDKTVQIGIWN